MQFISPMIILAAIVSGNGPGEEPQPQTPSTKPPGNALVKPEPPGVSEADRRGMLWLIQLLNSDQSRMRRLGLDPEAVRRAVHLPNRRLFLRPLRAGEPTLQERIKQYENAYRLQSAIRQLGSIGIDGNLAIRLCSDPDQLRSAIKALRTLDSLRDSK